MPTEPTGSIPTVMPDRKSPQFDSDFPPQDISQGQFLSKRKVRQTVSYIDESDCKYKSGGLKSGYRNYNSGSVNNVGDNGNCWLSTPNNENNGHQLNVNRNGLNPQNNNNRSNGYSVRPVLSESKTAPAAPFLPPKKFSFEDILFLLFQAYYKTRTSDRTTPDQLKFEIDYEKNLFDLARELYTGKYKFSPALCFVVIEKVKREVFAPQFRDRIVSTMLFSLLQPMLEPGFIFDSYSCRKGKGTSEGIKRFEHHLRSVTENYTKEAYVLYMDIEGYFMSIDHDVLKDIVIDKVNKRKHVKNPKNGLPWYKCIDIDFTLKLTEMFIYRNVKKDCIVISKPEDFLDIPDKKRLLKQPDGKGLIIGDQCSQLFSNIIGDILDQFIKHTMKCKHYGRYVDDAYAMHCDIYFLKMVWQRTDSFLRQNLKLNLHPRKTKIVNTKEGIAYLGAFVKEFRKYVDNKTLAHTEEKITALKEVIDSPEGFSKEKHIYVMQSLNSYLGHLKQFRTFHIRKDILKETNARKYYVVNKKLSKLKPLAK